MMKRLIVILVLFGGLVGIVRGQNFTDEEKEIIERGAELQVEAYVKRLQNECKQRAITRAMVIVDSLIRTQGLNERIEPIDKPPRPDRPIRPPVKTIPDSLTLDRVRKD